MSISFGKLADFITKLKKIDFKKDDYIIIYSEEKDVYSSFKRSQSPPIN